MARVTVEKQNQINKNIVDALKKTYDMGLISIYVTQADIDKVLKMNKIKDRPSVIYNKAKKHARGTWDISGLVGADVSKTKKTSQVPQMQPDIKPETGVLSNTVFTQSNVFTPKVFDVSSFVPQKNPNYIKYGHYNDIERIVASKKFFPTYIWGHTSFGKSCMVEEAHASVGRPIIRVNLDMTVDDEKLIGTKTLVNGNIEIIDGPVIIAMRNGMTLLLDEISAAHPNTILCLQGILEGKPYYYKLKNEIITPANGFNIIATDNTRGNGSSDGKYVGTNVLNEAFLERFAVTFHQLPPTEKIDAAMIKQYMVSENCYNEAIAIDLVKWITTIRMTFEQGAISDMITSRRLIHIIRTYSMFSNINKSIELCVNRFDDQTKSAFIQLWDKIHSDQPESLS